MIGRIERMFRNFVSTVLRRPDNVLLPGKVLRTGLKQGYIGLLCLLFLNGMAQASSFAVPMEQRKEMLELSRNFATRENLPEAVYWAKMAYVAQVNAVQASGREAAVIASWGDLVQEMASNLSAVLLQSRRDDEASQVMQSAKELELWATLPRGAPPDVDWLFFNSAESQLANAQMSLGEKLKALEDARAELLAKPNSTDAERRERLAENAAQVNALSAEKTRETASATVMLQASAMITPSLPPSRLRQALDARALTSSGADDAAVGIQYQLTESGVWCVLYLPQNKVQRTFVVFPRRDLEAAVNRLRLLVGNQNSKIEFIKASAEELYNALMLPLVDKLPRGHTLVISAQGVLRQVPFAALFDGHQFLMEQWPIVLFNNAAPPTINQRAKSAWNIAAMAVSLPVAGLEPLQGARGEAMSIIRQPQTSGVAFFDKNVTRAQIRTALTPAKSTPYNVLHLASHFVLRSYAPSDSRLYLGDGSSISLGEIADGNWQFDGLELLTLSACETALSPQQEAGSGRELESLGAVAQIHGAQAVLATLWKVNDSSTSAFMQRFYQSRGETGRGKAHALRQAQLAFLRESAPNSNNQTWRHPFHWASFVLMGDWQ